MNTELCIGLIPENSKMKKKTASEMSGIDGNILNHVCSSGFKRYKSLCRIPSLNAKAAKLAQLCSSGHKMVVDVLESAYRTRNQTNSLVCGRIFQGIQNVSANCAQANRNTFVCVRTAICDEYAKSQ